MADTDTDTDTDAPAVGSADYRPDRLRDDPGDPAALAYRARRRAGDTATAAARHARASAWLADLEREGRAEVVWRYQGCPDWSWREGGDPGYPQWPPVVEVLGPEGGDGEQGEAIAWDCLGGTDLGPTGDGAHGRELALGIAPGLMGEFRPASGPPRSSHSRRSAWTRVGVTGNRRR
jgi:hypothetical protein